MEQYLYLVVEYIYSNVLLLNTKSYVMQLAALELVWLLQECMPVYTTGCTTIVLSNVTVF